MVFELPILIFFLAMVGLVTPRGLWKFNRWFVVLAFILGAVLTPSPDVVSQVMMAAPMIVLDNLSILVSFLALRKRAKDATKPWLSRPRRAGRDSEAGGPLAPGPAAGGAVGDQPLGDDEAGVAQLLQLALLDHAAGRHLLGDPDLGARPLARKQGID